MSPQTWVSGKEVIVQGCPRYCDFHLFTLLFHCPQERVGVSYPQTLVILVLGPEAGGTGRSCHSSGECGTLDPLWSPSMAKFTGSTP